MEKLPPIDPREVGLWTAARNLFAFGCSIIQTPDGVNHL